MTLSVQERDGESGTEIEKEERERERRGVEY